MIVLPLSKEARQKFRALLVDQQVSMEVWWQPNDGSWYASLSYRGAYLFRGRRIRRDVSLIRGLNTEFVGELICRAIAPDADEPGWQAWGATHELRYEP